MRVKQATPRTWTLFFLLASHSDDWLGMGLDDAWNDCEERRKHRAHDTTDCSFLLLGRRRGCKQPATFVGSRLRSVQLSCEVCEIHKASLSWQCASQLSRHPPHWPTSPCRWTCDRAYNCATCGIFNLSHKTPCTDDVRVAIPRTNTAVEPDLGGWPCEVNLDRSCLDK